MKPNVALCELPVSRVPIGVRFQVPQSHPLDDSILFLAVDNWLNGP